MAIQVWQGAARDVVCGDAILRAGDIEFNGERIGVLSEGNEQNVFFGDKAGKIAVCRLRSDREEDDRAYVYVFPSPVFAKLFFGKELESLQ